MKDLIMDTVEDLVIDFLGYDRKVDEDLKLGDIQKAIDEGIITSDEIVSKFRQCLEGNL